MHLTQKQRLESMRINLNDYRRRNASRLGVGWELALIELDLAAEIRHAARRERARPIPYALTTGGRS